MILFIPLLILGLGAAAVGCLLLLGGLANAQMLICALLVFVISAVLISSAFIIASIVDLEKAVKDKGKPPELPR